MATQAQRKAVAEFRKRKRQAGIVRFEVAAPNRDKELIRSVARRLTESGPAADETRSQLQRLAGAPESGSRGGILRALRESPLVGAGIRFRRDRSTKVPKVDF